MKSLAGILLLAELLIPHVHGRAPGEDPDTERFEVMVLAQGLPRPMELTVTPDGRVLWIELEGRLRIFLPSTGEVVEAGTLEVFAEQENGLLGLALDPDFEHNNQLYLLYSPPEISGQRLSRFELRGNRLAMETEQELLTFEEQRRECCHHAGSLEFGPDGLLFIASGDNTHPGGDSQGFAPLDERPDRSPFDAQKGPANTQSLSGKILRIRLTETGYEIPEGNLFSDPSQGRPEIYVMGCRNPWRIGVDQRTGFVYWGEVGPDAGGKGERGPRGYDEINQARRAGNFGWPYFIADNLAYHDVDFDGGEVGAAFDPQRPLNESPNNTGSRILPPAQPAWIYYPYGDSEVFPELNAPGGRTACAGPVYDFDAQLDSVTKFPQHYDRCLFAFEWSRNWIVAVHLDGNSDIERIERFLPERSFKRPVDLEFGPDGALYMLEYGSTWGDNADSALVRIDYRAGNRVPRPKISHGGSVGAAPLVVQLSSDGTVDPDGDLLSYSWRVPPAQEVLSTSPNPELTFEQEGTYNLELTVRDSSGASATAVVPVLVGNTRPDVRFERPRDGGFLVPGEPIDWLVHISDEEDGESEDDPLGMAPHVAVEVSFHPGAPPASREAASAVHDPGWERMKSSDCFNCHAVDYRIIGPALTEIAARYRGDEDALEESTERVSVGSSGVWGEVPMLSHPQHSREEIRQMVAWVLALDGDEPAYEIQRGLRGLVKTEPEGGGCVLEANYSDGGSETIGPLVGRARLRLRHPAVEGEHFSSRSGTSTLSSESASGGDFVGAINSGNHLRFDAVDLDGIERVSLRVSSAGVGGWIELRSNEIDGMLLARTEVVPNGAWEEWYEIELPLANPGGLHDFLVVFGNDDGGSGLMNLDRLHFLRAGELAAAVAKPSVPAPYADWGHAGSLFLLTTPEGADLPPEAELLDFPLLVRLDRDWFDFGQAQSEGADLRFSSSDGSRLFYQIESWDQQLGAASIWVRVPRIRGNARQELRMHWGKPDAVSESSGAAVFSPSNGYLSVWHLGDEVLDEVGTLESEDTGTERIAGIVGEARHFPDGKGVYCGQEISSYPSGPESTHSTQVWFRAQGPQGRLVAWGNEEAQGKVTMQFHNPPQIRMDCYFSDADVRGDCADAKQEWTLAMHTYHKGESRLYINGVLAGNGNPRAGTLSVKRPARLWLGGWYNNYAFVGDLDEARVSSVARSADWARLEYENQRPMQTLLGTLVQPGSGFSLSAQELSVSEGASAEVQAEAPGAQKVYWTLDQGDGPRVVAVDRFRYTLKAGRVLGDESWLLRFHAIYPQEVKSLECRVQVAEAVPEPVFSLLAPAGWDGRETIDVRPRISNMKQLEAAGVAELSYEWKVRDVAVIQQIKADRLELQRSQNSGSLLVQLILRNGGAAVSASVLVEVQEPAQDAWMVRVPGPFEQPQAGQFYTRGPTGLGTLHYNGVLSERGDGVYLKLYAGDELQSRQSQSLGADRSYSLSAELKPGLIKYRVEFGSLSGERETLLRPVGDLLCGDAYIIQGQSNALATDTGEESPRDTHEWVRSYARTRFYEEGEAQNLWCKPVWKAQNEYRSELGWWGMELAKGLVESQQVPIFILNGAVGGTRIDQHQRNEANPTDLSTIYGRLLWRVRQARLTHGIRGIIWHQGESDQPAAGPTGRYGWEDYQDYFVRMSDGWKRDFPNLQHYYVFQIWPNACSMGNGNGDMLREVQRTLPRLYSNMDILPTLGITPPGGCHYPLVGWDHFASRLQPLIERDFYGRTGEGLEGGPNLVRASYLDAEREAVVLEFDQALVWSDTLIDQFFLDGNRDLFLRGELAGHKLTLHLKQPSAASTVSYLLEKSWKRENLLRGHSGMEALSFCEVAIE